MNYFDEVVKQHRCAKETFKGSYEFAFKQSDILHLAKVGLNKVEKDISKTEWHIKKTKRDIEKLQKHLITLSVKLKDLTLEGENRHNFLQAALSVSESDV